MSGELDRRGVVSRLAPRATWIVVLALDCGAPDPGSRAGAEPGTPGAVGADSMPSGGGGAPSAGPAGIDTAIVGSSPADSAAPADSPTPASREVVVYFTRDEEPYPVRREIGARSDVLTAALEELLRGPTAEERARGIRSWFSAETAGMLNHVAVDASGHAVVDFADFRRAIPNASSSAGSAMLLGELDATVGQFESVRSAEYRIDGSCEAFWNFLQRGCQIVRFR